MIMYNWKDKVYYVSCWKIYIGKVRVSWSRWRIFTSYSCHNNIIKMPQFYVVFFSVLAQHSWETSIWFPWLHVGTNYCQLFPANLCYYWRIWYLPVQVKVCYRGKLCSDCKYSSSWPWNSNFTNIYFSTTSW
jgi:hypothetical protein